uniref:Uncharacterized protein n=1 Tax=Avena sativa TaxID=4498 RepID=A0ACD5V2I3_AVESA
MEVTVHSSKLVKPDYGDRGTAGSSSDVIPLSVFDKVSYDEYVTGLCAFPATAPPNHVLQAGLAKALAEYREWAGRLGADAAGNRAILLDDAGARFVEATADADLAGSLVRLTTGDKLLLTLFPSCHGAHELLLAQVTRFRCGSVVIGVSMHHRVADGHAIWTFLFAWSQATRGAAICPVPVHDRTSLFAPRDPPRVEFDHRGNEFKPHSRGGGSTIDAEAQASGDEAPLVHRVHFSRERIMALKSEASEGAARPYSTLQCLAAHLWRCITKARGLDAGATTRMRIAVNGRARMRRVPAGYTGNVVLWAWPTTTAQDLVDRPLRDAVELVSREVARIDEAYFRSFIDFASSGAVEEERLVPTADSLELTLSPNVEVDSLLGIPFYEMDFGGSRPFFFLPGYSNVPVDGFMYIVQSFQGDGSVDAYVPLFRRTMEAFNKCC